MIVILIIIICIVLNDLISRPIKALAIGAKEISNRNYDYLINTDNLFGEFIILEKYFNEMSATINQYSKHLEQLLEKRTIELK